MKKKDEDQSENQVEGIIKLDIRTQDRRYNTSDVRLQVSGRDNVGWEKYASFTYRN